MTVGKPLSNPGNGTCTSMMGACACTMRRPGIDSAGPIAQESGVSQHGFFSPQKSYRVRFSDCGARLLGIRVSLAALALKQPVAVLVLPGDRHVRLDFEGAIAGN